MVCCGRYLGKLQERLALRLATRSETPITAWGSEFTAMSATDPGLGMMWQWRVTFQFEASEVKHGETQELVLWVSHIARCNPGSTSQNYCPRELHQEYSSRSDAARWSGWLITSYKHLWYIYDHLWYIYKHQSLNSPTNRSVNLHSVQFVMTNLPGVMSHVTVLLAQPTWDPKRFAEQVAGAFGRTNFCRFEAGLEQASAQNGSIDRRKEWTLSRAQVAQVKGCHGLFDFLLQYVKRVKKVLRIWNLDSPVLIGVFLVAGFDQNYVHDFPWVYMIIHDCPVYNVNI